MNDLDKLVVQNSGIRETLNAIVVHLVDNQGILVRIGEQVDEIAESITALSNKLETASPAVKHEVFVTTVDGYTFPVQQFNSVRDAYYWIPGVFTLSPYATSLLHRFNVVSFEQPQRYRNYEVVKVMIR